MGVAQEAATGEAALKGNLGEALRELPVRAEAEALYHAIVALNDRGDYAGAIDTARRALEVAEERSDRSERAVFLYLIARSYWLLGDYSQSLEFYHAVLIMSREDGNLDLVSAAHHGIGLNFNFIGNYEVAEQHFIRGLEVAEETGDFARAAYMLNGLGNSYLLRGLLDEAEVHYVRAADLRRQEGDRVGLADTTTNLGTIAFRRGDPTAALEAYLHALMIYEETRQPRRIALGKRRAASALRSLGRIEEGRELLHSAVEILLQLGNQGLLAGIYEELASNYEVSGDLRRALGFERMAQTAREQVNNEQTRQRMVELDARFHAARREAEIRGLRQQQEAATRQIQQGHQLGAMLAGGVGLVFGLGGILAWLHRARIGAERRTRAATGEARLEAERAARLRARLLQIAAHDLKAPLAALSASARRIEEAPENEAGVVEGSKHIRTDAAHMGSIVREFLESAELDAGRVHLVPGPVDCEGLAREVAAEFAALAETKSQVIEVTGAGGEARAWADAGRVRQIVTNLVANALKFSPSGGRVKVDVGWSGGWCMIEVADEGPGIKPEDWATLFDPFRGATAKPTGGECSTGLGLFITRELVAMHRGLLEVESQPGRGAIFRVLLPEEGAGTGEG